MYKLSTIALLPIVLASILPAQARDYGDVGGWQLASSGESCGLYSNKAGNGEIIILKRLDGALHIQVNSSLWRGGDGKNVSFDVDGNAWQGAFGITPVNDSSGRGYLAAFAPDFSAVLRGGSRLSVIEGERTLGIFSLSGTSAALNRMENCLNDLRRDGPAQLNIAAAVPSAVTSPKPQGSAGSWFNMQDYPAKAQREGREGTVEFLLTVGANGRVSKCQIAKSSGHDDIDESTCDAVTKRGRFDPAVDASGKKIEGSYESKVTWRVPGN